MEFKESSLSFKEVMVFKAKVTLDVLNRSSLFAANQIATGSHRFQIARFESQGQKPLESLLRLYYSFQF